MFPDTFCFLMYPLRHPLTPTDEASALAVVLVGLLPRLQFATKEAGDLKCQQALRALEERVLPALVRRVLQPHLQGRNRADVYGHTWGCGRNFAYPQTPSRLELMRVLENGLDAQLSQPVLQRVTLQDLPRPESIHVPIQRATAVFYFLLGVKRALTMVDDGKARITLLLRWDVVFYSTFRASELDPRILYRANWCRANGPWLNASCRGLLPFALPTLRCSDAEGVPDFWLASSLHNLRSALANASDALAGQRIQPKACPVAHGVLAAVLENASVPKGRYLFHQLDYDLVREKDGRRFDDNLRTNHSSSSFWLWRTIPRDGGAGVGEVLDESYDRPQLSIPSLCPANKYYCGCERQPMLPTACTKAS